MTSFTNTPRYLVAITPGRYRHNRLSFTECREIMGAARVEVAGWAMPFDGDDAAVGPGYLFERVDRSGIVRHLEEWRLYRSGQFLHRSIPFERLEPDFEERAREIAEWNPHGGPKRTVEASGFLSFVALIYFVTQAYLFAAKFHMHVGGDENAFVYVGLRDVENFALGSNDRRDRLSASYRVRMQNPYHSATLSSSELVENPILASRVAIESIFEQFNWDPARSRPAIESRQRAFVRGTQ
jgi:hypothetical protein